MTINYWFLCIALVLLWLPRRWLRIGKPEPRRRGARPARERLHDDLALRASEELTNRRNWLDFGRALAGGFGVAGSAGAITLQPGVENVTFWTAFVLQAAVLLVAVVMQTLRLDGRVGLYPPVFFLTGLMFGVLGWVPAALAFIAIWTIHIVLPTPTIFLAVYAAVVFALGVLLGPSPQYAALAAGLSLSPSLLSMVLKRRLLPVSKKAKIATR